jgi:hypothetical protein
MTYFSINDNIEEDNLKHLQHFKNEPPHPSYIAGMIDGDGCIFIRKIKSGYQSGISISQSRTNILQIIRYHFGGSITTSANRNNMEDIVDEGGVEEYYHKHNKRNQYNLQIRSNEYQIILEYIKDALIIKQEQINCLYEFNKFVNLVNKNEEKESLYQKYYTISTGINNADLIISRKINIEYIQGIFDAEGCIYLDKNKKTKFYISITQKKYPIILEKIKDFLGFGHIEGNIVFKIFKKSDCLKFILLVKQGLIVKYNQIIAFETFINSIGDNDKNDEIYKLCYQKCNEEKHQIENFSLLNQNEENKNGYLETIRLKEIKNAICKEILRRQVYKEKSQKMKGEGNHNYGKPKSDEIKRKLSIAIRDAKNGISDEKILEIRKLFGEGKTNIEVQELFGNIFSRHIISDIRNKKLVCRNEIKKERKENPLSQEEQNIKRRKITLEEIFIVIDKTILENKMPSFILQFLIEKRGLQTNNNIAVNNDLTIDIIKNIKRMLSQNKLPFYEIEFNNNNDKYLHYKDLINTYYKNINTPI